MTPRRIAVALVATAVLALVVQAPAATALPSAGSDALAEQMIKAKTGQVGQEVPAEGVDNGGHRIKPAKGLKTWLQIDGANVRLVAKLSEGESSGVFEDVVPEGWTIQEAADGSYDVLDADNRPTGGRILAPWAVDAAGKALPTHFELTGQSLRQVVDTEGATFPVVMDPTVTAGWWYVTPVYYIKYDWSGTWKLKSYIDDNRTLIAGLICNFLPNTVARTTCQAIFLLVRTDIINTVNAAIANKKCYKVRMPASGGAISLPAYDSYYVTC
jgi:hypothetical protein